MIQSTLKILIADTGPAGNDAIKQAFSQTGFNCTVIFSANHAELLNTISSEAVDILFINAAIPQSRYGELLLKAKEKSLPVIFITDNPDNTFSPQINKEEASDCISRQLMIPEVLVIFLRQAYSRRQNEHREQLFLEEINYQIRTPLNSIIGFSNALLETDRPDRKKEFLAAIKQSGENILELIDSKLRKPVVTKTDSVSEAAKPLTGIHFREIMKMKILLVEDDMLNIKLLEHLFSEYGMKTDVALNGKKAIGMLAANPYDLVLMDIEMPEMNGYEATAFMRLELKSNVPIIALTAHTMPGEREKCLRSGMNDYLTKPVNADHLFEIIYRTVKSAGSEYINTGKSVTNFNYLKETMSGKKDAIKEMFAYVLKQLPYYLSEMNNAVDKQVYDDIAKFSHKMKSAIAIIGVKSLEPVLAEMESLGKSDSGIDKIRSLNLYLNDTVNKAIAEVEIEKTKYR